MSISIKNVSWEQVFKPAGSLPGKVFDGLKVKAEINEGGIVTKFSFRYRYISNDVPALARKVASGLMVTRGELPEGVWNISFQDV
jgi:hypothetical protein